MDRRHSVELVVSENPEEHVVWARHIEPVLQGLPDNVLRICYYGFTEIFNNVIDHSESETASIAVSIDEQNLIQIIVADHGIGIFEKVKLACGLTDRHQAILEISKGGLTTDPERHSGQGIFFTSRAFDTFFIFSSGLTFGHSSLEHDLLTDDLETQEGTFVAMSLDANSKRTLKEVFDEYSQVDEGFTKTHILVRLAREGTSDLVSRSQAKRVLARCDRFQTILLDFEGVDFIGQAFADEIFRVFRRQHPEVRIEVVHANETVQAMLQRATTSSTQVPARPKPSAYLSWLSHIVETANRLGFSIRWEQSEEANEQSENTRRFQELAYDLSKAVVLSAIGRESMLNPDKGKLELLEIVMPNLLGDARQQAREMGLNQKEIDGYLRILRKVYQDMEFEEASRD